MFSNYLKIAVRNLIRHRLYSVINILGLAVGIAGFLYLLLVAQHEFSYDRDHEHADRIHLVVTRSTINGRTGASPISSAPIGPGLFNDYPEVDNFVRFRQLGATLRYADREFNENALFFADPSVFDIFTYPLLAGNPATALRDPYSIVLTETLARKYFAGEDPLNKSLRLDDKHDFLVTGIVRDVPPNSSFSFEALISFATAEEWGINQHIGHSAYLTYLLLAPGATAADIEEHSTEFVARYYGPEYTDKFAIFLQPLRRVYLYSERDFGFSGGGDIAHVYTLLVIGFLILLLACANYINLATAILSVRHGEIGMRKVLGAQRPQLFGQIIGESFLLSLVALAVGLSVLEIARPYINAVINSDIAVNYGENGLVLPAMAAVVLFVGVIAGSYPAWSLSRLRPAMALQGNRGSKPGKPVLRRVLVVVQFAITMVLITSAVVVYNQIHYMRNYDLGFDGTQVVTIPLGNTPLKDNLAAFKTELLKNPAVLSCAASSGIPGRGVSVDPYRPEGFSADENDYTTIYALHVDADFFRTYGIGIVAGREFSEDFSTDATAAVLINESAAREYGWTDPVGKKIEWLSGTTGTFTVVGVVKDFNYHSLHTTIRPLVFHLGPNYVSHVSVKISPDDVPGTIAFLGDRWARFAPNHPFVYTFVDDIFAGQYRATETDFTILSWFSLLAICIACLGLFGLASFSAMRRTKEIGIRKTLGASVGGIVRLLSLEFLLLVLFAVVIAWPVGYLVMNKWLQNFAYRTLIGFDTFVFIGLAALLIVVTTVSFQAIKAALANPVDSLRHE